MAESTIDQLITVQVRFSPGGGVQPVAFVWDQRTRYLAGLGRQWTEQVDGSEWRCFLAQTVAGDTVELRWNRQSNQWRLHRAWWRAMQV
ncbi:MAG TPA: hypothetical protein PKM78_15645 [Anaerolineae bacterium]|nr:hypothetical protein [Anaerolineae bacterium]HNU05524.1 hypothetical protein [Anaerolineae bacterium]